MRCTWEGCPLTAEHERTAGDGECWAKLCLKHDDELTEAIATNNIPAICACWVKAQGGPEAAALRMTRQR